MASIDLTGKQYGELTVIEKDIELSKQKKRIYWKCRCSCGREKSVRADGLPRTNTCGQCTNDFMGRRFGRLVVIDRAENDKFGHRHWVCKCDCGNIKIVKADSLKRGLTQSCGCLHSEVVHSMKFIDLTGQKFGKLTAESYHTENGKVYWKCKCDCGNYTTVVAQNLKNGHTQSCGCISGSIGEENIALLLRENNIDFEREKTFKDLPRRRFDFYIPSLNRVIEFDGKQHFQPCSWNKTEEDFDISITRDEEKNIYCFKNSIEIIRIPYTERDNITIEMILGNKYLLKENINECQDT
jgi:very-short-patch-repair endonuclease